MGEVLGTFEIMNATAALAAARTAAASAAAAAAMALGGRHRPWPLRPLCSPL